MNEYDGRGRSGDERRLRPEKERLLGCSPRYIYASRRFLLRETRLFSFHPQSTKSRLGSFTVGSAEPEEEAFSMVRKSEAAILKAKAKAKSKAHKEEVVLKARAKAEAEAAVRRAKAEAAKEAGVVKACCCGSDDDDVPYDKVYHDSDAEEDSDTIMARIVARWDIFMEEEARFPDQKYDPNNKNQVCLPVQRTGDASPDSDDEHEYYLRKFGMMK